MSFDNSGFDTDRILRDRSQSLNEFLPVDPVAFLNLFPYLLAFDNNLDIVVSGRALLHIMPDMHGRRITDIFNLQRPHIKFRWDTVSSIL
uniref:guanylate cyclase n=1 Tax=Romanomermis culicivorax TaxID=13658 RepID=A0A915KAJ3_ROMCU